MRVLIDVANGRPEPLVAPAHPRGVRRGAEWAGADGFVEWIYAELFEMPLGDAALGLDAPDPFADGAIRGYGANVAIQPANDVGPLN